MKKYSFLLFLLIFLIGAVGCGRSEEEVFSLNAEVDHELSKFNIHVTAKPDVLLDKLPGVLTDANWGAKQTVCKDGGYDLSPYVGQVVTLEKYPTDEVYNEIEPLRVGVVWNNDQIICIFRMVTEQSEMAPGIFSIKDNPSIQRKN